MSKEAVIRKKAIQILKDKGWIVWFAPKVKYQQTDVFGIIDLLAIKGKRMKKIQLTTLANVSTRRRKIQKFLKKFKIEMSVQIWGWDKKKKKFRKEKVKV
jgi:hypothetical protein